MTIPQNFGKIEKAIKFETIITGDMSQIFPHITFAMQQAKKVSKNPDVLMIGERAESMLAGALIVYLFSVWDEHFEHTDINTYFRDKEKERFYAFKHIRIIYAHNKDGNRKGNRQGQDRMDHADKLDNVMQSSNPINSIEVEFYKLTLKFPDAFLDCRDFMSKMANLLAAGRISAGGPDGQIRVAGGGTTPIM